MAFALLAAVTCLIDLPRLRAEENAPRSRYYLYFSPSGSVQRKSESGDLTKPEASDSKQIERRPAAPSLMGNLRDSWRRRPLFFRRTGSQVALPALRDSRESQPAGSTSPAPRNGQQVAARPVSRFGFGSMYPAIYGQTAPPASQPSMTYPPSAGAQGMPADLNSQKYAYASPGSGCCNGMAYCSPYNSGYYTSGCYEWNACCRTCRRPCTPFGGMFRGCGCSCYSPPPPPCPTTCYVDPCYGPTGTYYAPPAYGSPTVVPAKPAPPPAPSNPDDNENPPQPIEKKVTPEPQAKLSPGIPGLPPDA